MRIAIALVAAGAAALGVALVLWLAASPAQTAAPATTRVAGLAAPREARGVRVARRPVAEPRPTCTRGAIVSMRDESAARAAQVRHALTAFVKPGGVAVSRFGRINVNGVPTVFGVLAARVDASCTPVWYRVQLPLRPNGRTGWVLARDVVVTKIDTRVVVDLSERRVRLFKAGKLLLETVAAIGKPGTPTPTGSYYVNQRLLAADPGGPYGPGGIGISAFSPTLQNWVQGGPIAIHGTNLPHLLGEAVSHGCVRVDNAELRRLMELVPEGTPVVIRN